MKSKTSFFNPGAFRKDVTRFAPVWAIYTVILALGLTVLAGTDEAFYRTRDLAGLISGMPILNLGYAFILGQLLFGDLYNSRMCNALHALPLRRECWFGTHVVSGLAFALIPDLAAALVGTALLGDGWTAAFWWLAASALEFIFFFGTAALAAMLAGNRFGMLAVYGLINFLSILAMWFGETLFLPLMYGITRLPAVFLTLCPAASMTARMDLIQVLDPRYFDAAGNPLSVSAGDYLNAQTAPKHFFVLAGSGWGYLGLCAAIGVLLTALALLLYRRRNLETAGELIAVKPVKPVFLVLFTLGVGAFFQLMTELFSSSLRYLFLAVGICVGYFTGRMLMEKTHRVFRGKSFCGLGAIAAVMVLSLLLVRFDAFGVVSRVPQPEEIESAALWDYSGRYMGEDGFHTKDAWKIADIQTVHRYALEREEMDEDAPFQTVFIEYKLKNGKRINRQYQIYPLLNEEVSEILRKIFSEPSYVLGLRKDEIPRTARMVTSFNYGDDVYLSWSEDTEFFREENMIALLEALWADCEEGHMASNWSYHTEMDGMTLEYYGETWYGSISLEMESGINKYNRTIRQYLSLPVWKDCRHTIAWLEENGYQEIEYPD